MITVQVVNVAEIIIEIVAHHIIVIGTAPIGAVGQTVVSIHIKIKSGIHSLVIIRRFVDQRHLKKDDVFRNTGAVRISRDFGTNAYWITLFGIHVAGGQTIVKFKINILIRNKRSG